MHTSGDVRRRWRVLTKPQGVEHLVDEVCHRVLLVLKPRPLQLLDTQPDHSTAWRGEGKCPGHARCLPRAVDEDQHGQVRLKID